MKNISHQRQGFSLIEIMVIVSVVLVGMIGVLALLLQNIQAQTINKNHFIAYQMAQEGLEIVRAARDTFAVNGDNTFSASYPSGNEYIYSYDLSHPLTQVTGVGDEKAVCIDVSGLYNKCSPGDKGTIFSRSVRLTAASDADGSPFTKVVATVTWRERNNNYSYSLETHLYDWY